MALWVFDFDQTLFPSYITDIINGKSSLTINKMNILFSIMLNMETILEYITQVLKGKIIIVTASEEPWVFMAMNAIDNILKQHIYTINYNILKDYVIKYDIKHIKDVLGTEGYFTGCIKSNVSNILYVHVVENTFMGNRERTNKKKTLYHVMNVYDRYNDIIILGDDYRNERKYAIEMARNRKNKNIKFVQFHNIYNHTIKLHEQHLFYNNLNHINNSEGNLLYDIFNT